MPSTELDVSLVRAQFTDRRRVYDWMISPGIVEFMMGPPTFPDIPVPDFSTFCDDYVDHFWTHEDPARGRVFLIETGGTKVGCVTQNALVRTGDGLIGCELDIWLAGAEHTGNGYGRKAIRAMCRLIRDELSVEVAFLQPSARNPRACAAYAAAGFVRSPLDINAAAIHFQTAPDASDSVFFIRRLDRS